MCLMQLVGERRHEITYTVRVTCVEIYNEQVRDLFDTKKESLPVRHSKDHGFYLENATVVQCTTAKEIVRVVRLAATNRIKSSHLLNERSNRSHCLVTIYIDATPNDPSQGLKKYGKLTIVDLAGSERATDTGAVGQQLKETGHINKSLYCLSQVIQAMTINAKQGGKGNKFVPYRDSKLTMLLIDSLGGNSKTLMLACVNSLPRFATESIRTLEFAMGVAKIKNRPTAVLNPHEKLISDLKEEIRLLKLENMMLRSRTPGYFTEHGDMSEANQFMEELATSPLGNALLSSRHRPIEQHPDDQRSRSANNNVKHSDVVADATRLTRRTLGQERSHQLSTLKKKQAQRLKSKSPRKKSTKPRKQKPTVFSAQADGLPPVKPSIPLFQKRAQFPLPISERPAVLSAPARPSTPPPEYDDLFGVETVPVAPIKSSSRVLLEPLHPEATTSQLTYQRRVSVDAIGPNNTALDPNEHVQRLLREMMTGPSKKTPPSNNALSQPPKPVRRATSSQDASIVAPKAVAMPQFDDDRAQELFAQLCRL
ncbi:hypothetical protein Poli38472_006217 [Pythium oligandrum]|uniref:Kinesin-like protein n=1 Tax=Pythium oligandrum TaxID=41045 RepID=A0A8K1CT39_PYTOL|nr:hypothetical protein Poli38472_006217 [Pythium oligandrum]|eukprot:TMW68749.1 hypothetical protein Poli38472_006217 [Pythium oligandrum]